MSRSWAATSMTSTARFNSPIEASRARPGRPAFEQGFYKACAVVLLRAALADAGFDALVATAMPHAGGFMPATIAHRPHFTVPGSHISGKAVVWAGLAAGAIFLVLELLVTRFVMGISPGVMSRMSAASTQGSAMLAQPDRPDLSVTVAAVILHFVMSLLYAFRSEEHTSE